MSDPIRIVIVDDHLVVRAGLRALLSLETDMEVVGEFASPEQALPRLPALDADIVLMDLRFGPPSPITRGQAPATDGIEGVRQIRARQGPPVLVLTTYGSEPEILGALAAGAVGYVLKDSSAEELFSAIRAGVKGEQFLGRGVRGRVENPGGTRHQSLTEREVTTLRLVAAGKSNSEIAKMLGIAEATVKTHLNRSFTKLGVNSRTAAVVEARNRGFLEA